MTDPTTPAENPAPAASGELTSTPSAELAWALSRMAGLVLSRETVDTALELVTALAATATAGTLGSAVTIVDEHGKRSRAASNQAAEQADALQYELDEGPCLTAWRTRELVRIDDTTTDARWPRWNEAASRLGVRSVLSAPLLAADESIGAMKVYCERPVNYGPHDEHVMRLLAAQAAILLANSQSLQEARRLSRQLTDALTSRDAVAQAIGVLLAKGAADRQDAFATLAATARRSDRPIEDVARALLAAVTARTSDSAAT
ncbi:GAF and ANTAR domain-containing protein [Geodermatophilus sabuli]|uniref:GAF and ANTAR domain-containing protein n=1 Tax=Geodermatophilus sabuli TaxID=1564158 RepID=A0A7K3VV28_9ACTN|nr:GAF and ANTAR domain-containing protein [Geodermatophilus sabuli]NEK56499.1 GAF and ANTAR domain-containing protein [Geodermatophilus sabuli]